MTTAATTTADIEPSDGGAGREVVRQRLLLVLPTTAEFDSRTYRIASAAARRGHEVTVVARSAVGLPDEEVHPEGYRILRVPSRLVDGLPWRKAGRLPGSSGGQPPAAAVPVDASPRPAGTRGLRGITGRAWRVAGRVVGSVLRRFAIPLVIRAQRLGARSVAPPADIVHGMAYMGIPIALDLARRTGGRAVYDARDIYVDAANLARSPRWLRWFVGRAERGWARAAGRVITVNEPYAEVMARRWDIDQPLIVMNCSYRFDPPAEPDGRFQRTLGLDPETRIVLYQGGFSPDRGIEQLLEAIDLVPAAALVLMGYGRLEASLRGTAAASGGRVFVMAAVPPEELLPWVAAADVVAMPIQPTTLNHRLTTPNKLFEALAAGVPVVASDLPGMAPIVRASGAGRLVDPTDPAAIAAALRSILEGSPDERRVLREAALRAAHEIYNWEAQVERLFGEYSRLTGRRW